MSAMIKRPMARKQFNIVRSVAELEKMLPGLPDGDCYKFISTGGFSSISFVKHISKLTIINEFTATTLRVGKKELQQLDFMHKSGRLLNATLIVGSIMKKDSKQGLSYGYYDNFEAVCEKNGWKNAVLNNHSKILLFDTEAGKYVIETSSNLNENPKIEQFSFEKDAELYDFYYKHLMEVI